MKTAHNSVDRILPLYWSEEWELIHFFLKEDFAGAMIVSPTTISATETVALR
jgi:hypothetical protein